MHMGLGDQLIEQGLVTREQVDQALQRQKHRGGRLGANLVALGFLTESNLKKAFHRTPHVPESIEDTGLSLDYIADLTLKTAVGLGTFTIKDIAIRTKLTGGLVDKAIAHLKKQLLCAAKGGTGYSSATHRFGLTAQGRDEALKALEVSQYVGPAPVLLEDYRDMIDLQTVKNTDIRRKTIEAAFADLVVDQRLLEQVSPALHSGTSILLHGPSGNGKTVVAETIASLFQDEVYIPHAVLVDNHLIRVFDPINHRPVHSESERLRMATPPETSEDRGPQFDQRWVLCRRPIVIVGGELTLRMMDLEFDPRSKYYEAPLQMKANNGVFIVDDFGRQIIRPLDLLNRWIVPLERRIDFLTLHTGKKFEIPFDQLTIFSTNKKPSQVVDEAFMRRIRYKIRISHPNPEAYMEIFKRVCQLYEIPFDAGMVKYLLDQHYLKEQRPLSACHPRDIVEQVKDIARCREIEPSLTKELLDEAWMNYFIMD